MFWNSLVGNSFTSWNYWKKSKKILDSRTGVKKGLEPFSTSPWLLELESRRAWNLPVKLLHYWNGVKGLEPSSSTPWLLELESRRAWNLPVQLLDYWNWCQGSGTFQFNSFPTSYILVRFSITLFSLFISRNFLYNLKSIYLVTNLIYQF